MLTPPNLPEYVIVSSLPLFLGLGASWPLWYGIMGKEVYRIAPVSSSVVRFPHLRNETATNGPFFFVAVNQSESQDIAGALGT